jgi:hypothetical protein
MPAIAGWRAVRTVCAERAKASVDDVMSVGRNRVTPVFSSAATTSSTRSDVSAASPKSTPANPFTWRSTSPGNSTVRAFSAITSSAIRAVEAAPAARVTASNAPAIPPRTTARRPSSTMVSRPEPPAASGSRAIVPEKRRRVSWSPALGAR